jgi:Protein of unknown function (DUF3098)
MNKFWRFTGWNYILFFTLPLYLFFRMKSTKTTTEKDTNGLFDKANYMWMLGGAAIMILGFLLMAGGRSEDPNVFDTDSVYSTVRITIAPILILAGLVVEVYAIFRHPRD